MSHLVTLVPGDTTGPELIAATQRCFRALGVDVAWEEHAAKDGEITAEIVASAKKNKAVLLGYVHGRRDEGRLPPIVVLREKLGLFANIRPIRSVPGVRARHDGLDLLIVRETTEDVYAHLEHETIPGVYESLKVTTRAACERIARFAFEWARANGRKKVTIVHKSNIMKKSDGLFLKVGREVAANYPEIACDDVIVDALCMKLVIKPAQFDVLLTGNLFGDIVADVCAGLVGGAGNSPSLSFAEDGTAVFSAPHGDPPALVGTGRANPLTMLLPAARLLDHLGERPQAERLRAAVRGTLADGVIPLGLGGDATCDAYIDAVCARL